MQVTSELLNAFYRFGAEQLASGKTDMSWDRLFVLWESHNQRDDVNTAIREGIADADAGRYESVEKAMADIRDEFGIKE